MTNTIVLIVAAGRGSRAGGKHPKQYAKLGGQYVLTRTITAFINHTRIDQILVTIHPDDVELYEAATRGLRAQLLPPVHGGSTRQESVYRGLKALVDRSVDKVLIHDAARPFVEEGLIDRVLAELDSHAAVLPVLPLTDTIKQVENNRVVKTVARAALFGAQTPQGFRYPLILELHKKAQGETAVEFTDDASIAEWAGVAVETINGSLANQKLTTPRDLDMAELVLAKERAENLEHRTGFGFDVHRFEPGDGVVLCGVKVPFNQQLKGHSDADVAMHALTDALYGALGEGDIGSHFPPAEAQWRGAASAIFLQHAVGLVRKRGAKIINIDVTIICEFPKIGPHRETMRAELSRLMELELSRISLKATTTEQLGFTGRGEGIAAQAIATIAQPQAPITPTAQEEEDKKHV